MEVVGEEENVKTDKGEINSSSLRMIIWNYWSIGRYPLYLIEMATNINVILDDYKNHDDIATEQENVELENFLDFDYYGKYEFAHCGICSGSLLGHMKMKCSQRNNVRYEEIFVKGFKDWLKTVKGFREAVNNQNKKKERERNDMQVVQIRDTVRTVLENMERKGAGDANTTQLIKSIFPPIWSGQEFD